MLKFKSFINQDTNKINWSILSENTNAIQLLEQFILTEQLNLKFLS